MSKTAATTLGQQKRRYQFSSDIWLFIPCLILLVWVVFFIFMLGKELYWQTQQSMFLALNQKLSVIPEGIWGNITMLGDAAILLPILALFTLKQGHAWLAVIVAAPITAVASQGLKAILSIPRPAAVLDISQFHVAGQALTGYSSLPSGHTMTVFAAVVAVLSSISSQVDKRQYWLWCFVLVGFAVFTGISRVAVGAHWPFDIVLGAILGWVCGFLGAYIAHHSGKTFIPAPKIIFILFSIWALVLLSRAYFLEPFEFVLLLSSACALLVAIMALRSSNSLTSIELGHS